MREDEDAPAFFFWQFARGARVRSTWQYEEDPGDEGEDGALRPDVSDVADDEGREDEEQRHHGEGRGGPDHFFGGREKTERRTDVIKNKSFPTIQIKHFTPFKEFLLLCCEGNTSWIIQTVINLLHELLPLCLNCKSDTTNYGY